MSIFDKIEEDEVVTIDESKDYVAELIGEGKKFKDISALAKGKAQSDEYIEILKARLDEARKEINTRSSLDSFLEEIKKQKNGVETPPAQAAPPSGTPEKVLDDSELEARLEAMIAKRESQRSNETNLQKVQRVLEDNFGTDANKVINTKSKELGMTLESLQSLATSSPTAFLRLVGASEERSPVGGVPTPRTGVNSFHEPSTTVKNKAYFDRLKRDNPKQYWDPKTAGDMVKARVECANKGIAWE